MIIWFTGQPGAGKTTLAEELLARGAVDFVVDGDHLRRTMPNPGYDRRGRLQNIDRAQAIASYLADQGHRVAVALVAPYRHTRERFKAEHEVVEVYVHTAELRGREEFHSSDYQPPVDNYIELDTGEMTVAEAAAFLLSDPHVRRTLEK
jgi:adenylylsulfate kinase